MVSNSPGSNHFVPNTIESYPVNPELPEACRIEEVKSDYMGTFTVSIKCNEGTGMIAYIEEEEKTARITSLNCKNIEYEVKGHGTYLFH